MIHRSHTHKSILPVLIKPLFVVLLFSSLLFSEGSRSVDPPFPATGAAFSPLFAFGIYGQEAQNRFLIDGTQGFIAGREFYQRQSDFFAANFIWLNEYRLPFGPDRTWQDDTLPIIFRKKGGGEIRDVTSIFSSDMAYEVLDGLRLHVGADKQEEYPAYERPAYRQVNGGAAYAHRGAVIALQANAGYWYSASPVSGRVYPWEGYNTELLYKVADDFDLSLVDQELDTRFTRPFYRAHWSRSELKMSFPGTSEGNWTWRLDLGFQRRQMSSDSLFQHFLEQSYPLKFHYHEVWQAPDSIPLTLISSGSLGVRDRIISVHHNTDFKEAIGTHHFKEMFKGYYRYTMEGYHVPEENFVQDSNVSATAIPGQQPRGFSSELEFKEKHKRIEVGMSGIYAMEWELPVFELVDLDTMGGKLERSGGYVASNYFLQNGSVRVFANGSFGSHIDSVVMKPHWTAQAGWRNFWGHDVNQMEFKPSEEWAGTGVTGQLPWNIEMATQLNYLSDKEVRGWGPVYTVPGHVENEVAVSQEYFKNGASRLKLMASLLHAFGKDIRERPNGNALHYRVLIKIDGAF